jgi:2Fe-2S ferredoxin
MKVRFNPSGRSVDVRANTTLIDAVNKAGLPIASSCGAEGNCGKCGLRVLAGHLEAASSREKQVAKANRLDPALRLACMVTVNGDIEVSADYW